MGLILPTERSEILGAAPPPPGVVPDFEHPESHGYLIILVTAIMLPIATLVLFLRIYTRVVLVRYLGSDDYAIILSWICILAYIAPSIFLLKFGLGVHMWNVPLANFSPHLLKIGAISGIFYGLGFLFTKVSILLFYLRFSPYHSFRIVVWAFIAITTAYTLPASFHFVFTCQPIAKNWDLAITSGKCISRLSVTRIILIYSVLTIITDIGMVCLPIAVVRKLKLPPRQKIALAALFMTGALVCIVSCIRLKILVVDIHTKDYTWHMSDAVLWTIVEMCVGLICASLVSLKPFFRRYFPSLLKTSPPPDTVRPNFSWLANPASHPSTTRYGSGSSEGSQQNCKPKKSREQPCAGEKCQENTLGGGDFTEP